MKSLVILLLCMLSISCVTAGCKSDKSQQVSVKDTLYDKSLDEIKQYVKGKWELVSGQNASEICEFENTFITFSGDNYTWTEEGESEKGELNWRKAPTGIGYDAYLMDVFYAEHPSFPLAINKDTLYIQDCTETAYKYTLIRRK